MKVLPRTICAGFLSALLILISLVVEPPKEASPVHLNNSATKQDTQQVQAQLTPKRDEVSPQPAQPTEEVAVAELAGAEPDIPKAKENAEVKVNTPVLTPKEQAKATLEDLGHGDAWYAVEYIGFKESSWNPAAINEIGACGLFQALPCEKMNCELSDVPCQVRWATKYATQRYGTWHNAYSFWKKNNWW